MFPATSPLPSFDTWRWLPPGTGGKTRRVSFLPAPSQSAGIMQVHTEGTYITAVRYDMSRWCFVSSASSPAG